MQIYTQQKTLIKCAVLSRALKKRSLIRRVLLTSFLFNKCEGMEISPLTLFGLRLKEIRKIKGISQERLALECGIVRSYLGEVERGKRNIAVLNIYKLAETLGVPPSSLLEPPTQEKD